MRADARLWVVGVEADAPSRTSAALLRREREATEALHLSPYDDLRRGDLVVETSRERGRVLVHPPARVLTEPVPVSGRRATRVVLLGRPAGLAAYPIGIVTAGFRTSRLDVADPLAPGLVTSARHREALLDLWALVD